MPVSIGTIRELVEDDLRKAMGLSAGECSARIGPATEGGEIAWSWLHNGRTTVRVEKADGTVVLVHLRACVQIENVEVVGEDD